VEGKLEPDEATDRSDLGRSRETWRVLFEVDDAVGDVD